VVEGDTDRIATGTGTGGSWSMPMGGGAIALTAEKVIEKGKRVAAHLLETAPVDIAFRDGQFAVAGTDRRVSLARVVAACFDPKRLPPGETPGLDESARHVPDNYTFPMACTSPRWRSTAIPGGSPWSVTSRCTISAAR